MNAEQQEAFTAAVRGHNALIFGQAGTGKKFLMMQKVQDWH
jgi:DNA replication protein DnaC